GALPDVAGSPSLIPSGSWESSVVAFSRPVGPTRIRPVLRFQIALRALRHRYPMSRVHWPNILRARPDQAVVIQLLDHMGCPPGNTANCKNGRIKIDVDAQRGIR